MADNSKIEWTDATWSPVTGCTQISAGCKNCYAKRMARRLAGRYGYPEAPHHFDITLRPDRLEQPLKWRKPKRIFVCSMSDLFHEDVAFLDIADIFQTIIPCRQHTFQILTKRPQRMREYFDFHASFFREAPGVPDNVHLGVTVCNPDELWKIDELLKIQAAFYFVSLEPLLGEMDIRPFLPYSEDSGGFTPWGVPIDILRDGLDQVIVGGETGHGARPMHPDWARSLRDQCQAAGVPFFFKSWGAWIPGETKPEPFGPAEPGERCIEHNGQYTRMYRVGSKHSGRELDGVEWNEMPK